MSSKGPFVAALVLSFLAGFGAVREARGEAMLQYFNTDYAEITAKMPELAEAGYGSIWLPPPTKGSGGLSVGYDLFDRFDLGSKDQRGSVRTRYGTEAELLRLIETAHRFGIRVYLDNVMNHNSFDVPGYDENTPIDVYPGFVPEDFHLRITEDGFYRKWDNTRNWGDTWQVQNLGLADLIDIAQEDPNTNFGHNEGDDHVKIVFVRHPNNPEYYLDTDLPIIVTNPQTHVTFTVYPFANKEPFVDANGNGRFDWTDANSNGQHDVGEASEPFTDTGVDPTNPAHQNATWGYGDGKYNMGNPVTEDVNSLLIRSARWIVDRTKADGYRLDAVKHVPDYFFGEQNPATKNFSDAGYLGGAQAQFNITHGYSDWDNHRDTVFDTEAPRDDAMMFGEHLGEPPGFGGYWDAGMRLVDNPLRNELNNRLGSPWAGLNGFDQPGWGGFQPTLGVMHAQSHDNDYAARRELQHALYFTRQGLGLLYTDGNHHAGTLGQSGGAFPRHANTAFLGQWGDNRIPNLLYIHNQFARGYQIGRWSSADFIAYERIDKRENGSMPDSDGVTLLFMLNDNYASGKGCDCNPLTTSFPAVGGTGDDAYLYNYSTYGGGFYVYASQLHTMVVPPGGYFAFSWRNPEQPEIWAGSSVSPITILQNGQPVGTMSYVRKDGPDGDPGFNPYGVTDTNTADYAYTYTVPRVTSGTNLTFIARADGSAENILLKLDGGVPLNDINHSGGDARDNPPAVSTDVFLGYEQMYFQQRAREKFAAVDTARNIIGSSGAETYACTIGTPGFTVTNGSGLNNSAGTALWAYHDSSANIENGGGRPNDKQFTPAPQSAAGQPIDIWLKVGYAGQINKAFIYYTTDGTSFPEGVGGQGKGTTQVIAMQFHSNGAADGTGTPDWWKGTIPALPGGTVLRYKVGTYHSLSPSIFPGNANKVALKTKIETLFAITNFNATTVAYRPHDDYGEFATGLKEGFHVLRARSFLKRDESGIGNGKRASIYNTDLQTFYYDAQLPTGEIKFPANNGDTVGGSEYGAVVRTDPTVVEVWYHIDDSDSTNDDMVTKAAGGNGMGFEPFTDNNSNGTRDTGEPFVDFNGNGVWDSNVEAWAKATMVVPTLGITSAYPDEWRFNYRNIPASSSATIKVRLRELSSSANLLLTSDTTGHFTTLVRTVNTSGPDVRMFIAFPANDGDTVSSNYVMKTYFTKSLADGISSNTLLSRFVIKIASTVSGSTTNAVVQNPALYSINYNATATYHELAYKLPNLYNNVPDFLHTLIVTHDRGVGFPLLTATRLVKAEVVPPAPLVEIINPPEFDSDGKPFEIVLPDVPNPTPDQRKYPVQVKTETNTTSCTIAFELGVGQIIPDSNNLTNVDGSAKFWNFVWTNMTAGTFRFRADIPGNSASRNARVVFREIVVGDNNGPDDDDDDDGLLDANETTPTELPPGNPEDWNNGQVHIYYAYGHSNPLSPDTDGDGLPDGLEVGWRTAVSTNTNLAADTDGDGFPNFIGDLDPPFYNTLDNLGKVPNVNTANEGGDRAKQMAGTVTDPNNPDTDGDGIPDGVEDKNRNGWVDGDGQSLATNAVPSLARSWPNGKMDPGETWLETSPVLADSDADGLSDGYGEDKNFNGFIDGDTNTNRVYNVGELWTETDPLNRDTDGDGLPDGWEVQYGLDPLDNGTLNLRTGGAGNPNNGASGDPDSDGFTNLEELTNGTDPKSANTGAPPPPGRILIGPVASNQVTVVGAITNLHEFTDWSVNDLLVLDEYEGNGFNNQGGDTFLAYDGFDSSRDLVAFYAHDGGDTGQGGDGNFYFRVDLHDLKAFAEDGNLDIYVVIDTGNQAVGEFNLPDDVDTGTDMRWEAVVAVYKGNVGAVYVDTNPASNSTVIGQDLTPFGVQRRDQTVANSFKKAYFNSELDAVEFSISRQALRDAGWNGLNAADLRYQVFTTKDGTCNSCNNGGPGAGDLGGRSDIRDAIYDDWIAEDYWNSQSGIAGNKSVLHSWFGVTGSNDRGKRAKVITLIHGNQAIQPGSFIQQLINTGIATGYYRPLDVHQAYGVPMALHVTPTLASAIQWAKVDPAAGKPWRDGPAFNARLASLISSNVIDVLGSTFSDHILPYFNDSFNADNVALADEFLATIYQDGSVPSASVLWPPERVVDSGVLNKVANLGFGFTFIDQMRHVQKWFGRTSALGDDGYRLNQINGVKCFVINDQASTFRFLNTDNGLNLQLRELFSRKARTGQQDQVVILMSNWEDFTNTTQAVAYDLNIRWLASHPWIQLVTPDQIAGGQVDLSQPPDGFGDTWGTVNRGTQPSLPKVAHDWIDHASQENYDNWYNGSAIEESLSNKFFNIRSGVPLSTRYGAQPVSGIASSAWSQVVSISSSGSITGLKTLARGAVHASVFETAFHNQSNHDLSKFSTGAYINPDTGPFQTLVDFARAAQSQTRTAALYKRVATWATTVTAGTLAAEQSDVDLDSENEYLLYNDRLFCVFERIGGRLIAGFVRDIYSGQVYQTIGNQLGFAGSETEEEGTNNVVVGKAATYRTSAFKDWFALPGSTSQYINNLYAVTNAPTGTGWKFTSGDTAVTKTIRLAHNDSKLEASYALGAGVTRLFIRHGFSPDLYNLLLNGQAGLQGPTSAGGKVMLVNSNAAALVTLSLNLSDTGAHTNTVWNSGAVDDDGLFDTINMRNQAQTQQIETSNTVSSFSFALQMTAADCTADSDLDGLNNCQEAALGTFPNNPDSDGDGMNDGWESQYRNPLIPGNPNADPDGDGATDLQESIAGTNPDDSGSLLRIVQIIRQPNGNIDVVWSSVPGKQYQLFGTTNLQTTAFSPIGGTNTAVGILTTNTDTSAAGTAKSYKVRVLP